MPCINFLVHTEDNLYITILVDVAQGRGTPGVLVCGLRPARQRGAIVMPDVHASVAVPSTTIRRDHLQVAVSVEVSDRW